MQEFDKADELYQAGMKVDPQNANLLVHRGLVALQAKGDISKAVELITRGLDIDEKLASVLFRHDKSEANEGGHPHMTQLANRPSLVGRSTI